jgi:hypothetical protein
MAFGLKKPLPFPKIGSLSKPLYIEVKAYPTAETCRSWNSSAVHFQAVLA